MLMTPVYYPMYAAATRHDRVLVDNPWFREGIPTGLISRTLHKRRQNRIQSC